MIQQLQPLIRGQRVELTHYNYSLIIQTMISLKRLFRTLKRSESSWKLTWQTLSMDLNRMYKLKCKRQLLISIHSLQLSVIARDQLISKWPLQCKIKSDRDLTLKWPKLCRYNRKKSKKNQGICKSTLLAWQTPKFSMLTLNLCKSSA